MCPYDRLAFNLNELRIRYDYPLITVKQLKLTQRYLYSAGTSWYAPGLMLNADVIKSSLAKILDHLGLKYSDIAIGMDGDVTRVEIASDEASRIIGWHGETLNSIQHVLKSIVRTAENLERTPLIIVDADGYRKMQEEKVKKIADAKADFVRRTGNRIALSPMSPYFRRVVHLYIASSPNFQDLATESVGQGDYRQIVLRLKDEKKSKIQSGEELAPIMPGDDGLENLDI